jgi:anti-sigma B factor antagonist
MAITTTEFKRCQLVKMDGRIDSNTGDDLLKVFNSLNENDHFKIVFDMSDIDFMSSKGWWVLIETQKACRRYNRGELVLAGVQDNILSSLDLVGMSHYFKIYDDVVSAVGQF